MGCSELISCSVIGGTKIEEKLQKMAKFAKKRPKLAYVGSFGPPDFEGKINFGLAAWWYLLEIMLGPIYIQTKKIAR